MCCAPRRQSAVAARTAADAATGAAAAVAGSVAREAVAAAAGAAGVADADAVPAHLQAVLWDAWQRGSWPRLGARLAWQAWQAPTANWICRVQS
eukprot:4895254-Alexandrium_andersonii.AAC.1